MNSPSPIEADMRESNELLTLAGVIVTSDNAAFQKISSAAFSIGLRLKRLTVSEARVEIAHHKVHAVIVDCRESGADELIPRLRMHGSNRHCVVFALASDVTMMRSAHMIGANFVLDVPVRMDAVSRCLRAARGLMISEYRRYLRVPSDGVATVVLNGGEGVAVRVSNLSVGGMAIVATPGKKFPNHFHIRFALGEHKRLDLSAQVVWSNGRGEYGLHFMNPTPGEREALSSWVESRDVRMSHLVAAQVGA